MKMVKRLRSRKNSKSFGKSSLSADSAVQTYTFSDVQRFHNGQGIRKQTELVNGKGKTVVTTFPDRKVIQTRINNKQ